MHFYLWGKFLLFHYFQFSLMLNCTCFLMWFLFPIPFLICSSSLFLSLFHHLLTMQIQIQLQKSSPEPSPCIFVSKEFLFQFFRNVFLLYGSIILWCYSGNCVGVVIVVVHGWHVSWGGKGNCNFILEENGDEEMARGLKRLGWVRAALALLKILCLVRRWDRAQYDVQPTSTSNQHTLWHTNTSSTLSTTKTNLLLRVYGPRLLIRFKEYSFEETI